LKDIELACDPHRVSENLFYALRVDGVFDTLHARAVHPVPKGSRLLDAAKAQLEFHFDNVEGTLVCLWSPRYSGSFSVPGYHFHFIRKTAQKAVTFWTAPRSNFAQAFKLCLNTTFNCQ
jgi:acetolactate decarboxylase